jgi:hypothetical protein
VTPEMALSPDPTTAQAASLEESDMTEPYSSSVHNSLVTLIESTVFSTAQPGEMAYLASRVDTFWDLLGEMLASGRDITPLVLSPRFLISRGMQESYSAVSVDHALLALRRCLAEGQEDDEKYKPGMFGSLLRQPHFASGSY